MTLERRLASLRTFRGYTEDEAELAALAADVVEEAHHLYERVEMDESVGMCLSDRVPSLRLGDALRRFAG